MKRNIIIGLIVLIGLITVVIINNKSYALDDDAKPKDWNVYFNNLKTSIVNGSAFVPMEPEIEATSVKAYDVLISKKGDFATFTFDLVNSGDFDAKLESLSKLEPTCISLALPANKTDEELVCNNLEYMLTYTKNNKEVVAGDIVKAHTKENVTLRVGFSNNASDNPIADVQITLYDMNLLFNHLS